MGFIENLEKELFEMQDLKYRDFHSKLLPGIDKGTVPCGSEKISSVCK